MHVAVQLATAATTTTFLLADVTFGTIYSATIALSWTRDASSNCAENQSHFLGDGRMVKVARHVAAMIGKVMLIAELVIMRSCSECLT